MSRKQKEHTDRYNTVFAIKLRLLIKEKGITQQELADHIGKTRQAVSYYCDGSSAPDWETIAKIAKYFNVTSDYLLGLSHAKSAENTNIVESLGLSEETIQRIKYINCEQYEDTLAECQPIKMLDMLLSAILSTSELINLMSIVCEKMLVAEERGYKLSSFNYSIKDKSTKINRNLCELAEGKDSKGFFLLQSLVEDGGCEIIGGCEMIELYKYKAEQSFKRVLSDVLLNFENSYEQYVWTMKNELISSTLTDLIEYLKELNDNKYLILADQFMKAKEIEDLKEQNARLNEIRRIAALSLHAYTQQLQDKEGE